MKNILIFFGILLINLDKILAQNYLFKPNKSGPHIDVQYYNYGQNIFVINPGYTFNGKLTTGLIGSTNTGGLGRKYNSYGANASYMPLKEGIRKLPFSISIDAIYTVGKYKTLDSRYKTLQLGPSIYKRINFSEKLSLIPGIRIIHDIYTTRSSNGSYTSNYWGTVFQVSAMYSRFQVTASANKSVRKNYFAIAIGLVFP